MVVWLLLLLLHAVAAAVDDDIRDVRVVLYSNPNLLVNVSFSHSGQTHEFANMELIHPVALQQHTQTPPSTTFRFHQPPHDRCKKWATLTLLPNDRVSGLFTFTTTTSAPEQQQQYTVEINTNYITKDRQLQEDEADKQPAVMAKCGTTSAANASVASPYRPPPDPEGKLHSHSHSPEDDDDDEDEEDEENDYVDDDTLTQRRRLELLKWTGACFPRDDVARVVHIGVAYDQAFAQRSLAEGYPSPEKLIETAVAKASAVYLAQMNIHIQVSAVFNLAKSTSQEGQALVRATRLTNTVSKCPRMVDPMSLEVTELDCCTDELTMDGRLALLKTWSNTLPLRAAATDSGEAVRLAHWHLFTDCHPTPGFVGRSFIGTLCHATYPVGLTSFGPESTPNVALWRIFAHELGHSFNASHSFENGVGRTGGIMDYGDGKFLGDYQFHYLKHDDVCSELASQVDSCAFFSVSNTRCGDGFVDTAAGEECDCGGEEDNNKDCARDCDAATCKLIAPSQCVRHQSECCTARGTWALANDTVCTTTAANQRKRGVCISGQCQANGLCPNAAPNVCEAPTSCQVACGPNCNILLPLPDGVQCDENKGTCLAGKCVAAASAAKASSSSGCVNWPAVWWDVDGPTYSCAWYEKRPAMCASYGFRGKNFGLTAMDACCVCGGGSTSSPRTTTAAPAAKATTTTPTSKPSTDYPTKKPTKAPTGKPTTSPTGKPTKRPTAAPTSKPTYAADCPAPTSPVAMQCRTKKNKAACGKASPQHQCTFCKVTSKSVLNKYRKKQLCVPGPTCAKALSCGLL